MLAHAISDEPGRQRLIASLTDFVQQNKFPGVCVDFEEPPPATQQALLTFIQELHQSFGAKVCS